MKDANRSLVAVAILFLLLALVVTLSAFENKVQIRRELVPMSNKVEILSKTTTDVKLPLNGKTIEVGCEKKMCVLHHKAYGVTFQYPETWKLNVNESAIYSHDFKVVETGEGYPYTLGATIRIMVEEVQEQNVDTYLKNDPLLSVAVREKTDAMLDGEKAVQYKWGWESGGGMGVASIKNGKAYTILLNGSYVEFADELEMVRSSFRFD